MGRREEDKARNGKRRTRGVERKELTERRLYIINKKSRKKKSKNLYR